MDPQEKQLNRDPTDLLAPRHLLCELRQNPLGISRRSPAFCWQLSPSSQKQTAYQIQVASAQQHFTDGSPLDWDSGKVESAGNLHVPYGGRPLQPGTLYYWRVRSWNEHQQASPFSEPASFATGLWDGWQAQWIWSPDPPTDNQHVYFRRQVWIEPKPIRRVLAFVSADDYYKLYVNGQFVGQGPAPGYPDIQHHSNTLDLTAHVEPGTHLTLAAHAYYQGLTNYVWVSGDGRRGFILQLSIEYRDGTVQRVCTDEAWRAHLPKGRRSSHIIGMQTGFNEDIDARAVPLSWESANFDDASWPHAVAVPPTQWQLHPQETEMLLMHDLEPVEVVERAPGHYFIDFGREVVGTLRATFHASDGDTVEVRLGEELTQPHTVRHDLRCNCLYQDHWTLRDGTQELEHYDYRGFRFAELIAPPGVVDAGTIRAVVRHYPCDPEVSDFTCSDHHLNALWDLTKYSTIMGTQEIYMDCPTREKANYSLDTYLEMSAALYQTGEANLGRRTIELLLQSAPDGKLRCLGPAARDHFFTEYTLYPILMAWRYYEYTADTAFLERNFAAMQRVISYFRRTFAQKSGLLKGTDAVLRDLVDWPVNRRDGHEILPYNIVVNAVYYNALTMMGRVAEIVGDQARATRLANDAQAVAAAINERMWDAEHKRYVDGLYDDGQASTHSSLHANVFPLAMGVVPPGRVRDVVNYTRSRGFNCNTFLAMFLFEALFDHGAADHAFELLTADGENSPLHMVRQGATTTWETWALEQKKNASLFHPATAFTGYILASRVMGVQPLEPGYKKIRIQPQLGPLRHGEIRVPTLYGPVEVSCMQDPGRRFLLQVDVPPNTTAQIWLPRMGSDDVTVRVDGMKRAGQLDGDWITAEVGPGRHQLERARNFD